MTPAARLSGAIDLLAAIEGTPRRPADGVANDFFRNRRYIGSGDRRGVAERVWTVIRARRRLEWWLRGQATPRLLVAASLLTEGWTLPAVGGAFSGGLHAEKPLMPPEVAALRPVENHSLDHPEMPDPVRLEVPDEVFPWLRAAYGYDTETELLALLEPAPLDLRVNTLLTDRDAARASLAAEGIETELTKLSPWGLRAAPRTLVTGSQAFKDGWIDIQDEGSQLVALMTDARPGMRVCDFCAGAGGKTLALAMAMGNRGHIVACDVSGPRLDGAVKRLRRAGAHNVERHLLEAGDKWAKRRAGTFDRVLVDAPCTGSGTWRRNPDARLRLSARTVGEIAPKQAAILDDAAKLVKPGGRLVYATCSILPPENEGQVDGFLSRHPEFARAGTAALPGRAAGADLRLSPARDGTDGFFAAALVRQAAPAPAPATAHGPAAEGAIRGAGAAP